MSQRPVSSKLRQRCIKIISSFVGGHGAWSMGHGAWSMGHGAWGMGHRVSV